jgi:hypothetical protein
MRPMPAPAAVLIVEAVYVPFSRMALASAYIPVGMKPDFTG